jgi:hypothetical protein
MRGSTAVTGIGLTACVGKRGSLLKIDYRLRLLRACDFDQYIWYSARHSTLQLFK